MFLIPYGNDGSYPLLELFVRDGILSVADYFTFVSRRVSEEATDGEGGADRAVAGRFGEMKD